MEPRPIQRALPRPLCVDLDGTLIRSDILMESVLTLLKQNPFYVLMLPVWLLKGKANFKLQIARRVNLAVDLLPYNRPFLDYLRTERSVGRPLILTTASNVKFAEAVSSHLRIFDQVFASDDKINLSGRNKRDRLLEVFGAGGFDYAGNAKVDVAIWAHARVAILVDAPPAVRRAVEKHRVQHIFESPRPGLKGYLQAMRPHQWAKNLLVFVPLALAHRILEPVLLLQAGLAFLSFGFCASSVYLLNDLLDLDADRRHPTKRHRPFASGSISIVKGSMLVPVLLVPALALALLLPIEFLLALLVYYATTLAYSIRLKRTALADVFVLAGLYSLRLLAGAASVRVALSFWLLAFSMFLFLSLALVKRYTEVLRLTDEGRAEVAGRGYRSVDLETLASFGSASGYMAVLVLALYINSEAVVGLYTHSQVIWLLCPLILYIVSRIWLLARRDELHEDPVVFVLRDRRTQWIVCLGALLLWLAA